MSPWSGGSRSSRGIPGEPPRPAGTILAASRAERARPRRGERGDFCVFFFHSSDPVALVYRESLFEVGMAHCASSQDAGTSGEQRNRRNFVISLACNGRKSKEVTHALDPGSGFFMISIKNPHSITRPRVPQCSRLDTRPVVLIIALPSDPRSTKPKATSKRSASRGSTGTISGPPRAARALERFPCRAARSRQCTSGCRRRSSSRPPP